MRTTTKVTRSELALFIPVAMDEACSAARRLLGEGYGRETKRSHIILMSSDFLPFAAHLNRNRESLHPAEYLNGSDLRALGFDGNIVRIEE
jgi:hypothetical protein